MWWEKEVFKKSQKKILTEDSLSPREGFLVSKTMSKENEPLYRQSINGNPIQEGYAIHNVGKHGVLRASPSKIQENVDDHYGLRCGHIPDTPTTGIIVRRITPAVEEHILYIASLIGKKINVREFRGGESLEGCLIVPYINTPEIAKSIEKAGGVSWGLPPEMVNLLKNKAESHEFLRQHPIDGLETPDFTVCYIDNLLERAAMLLQTIEDNYIRAGSWDYPLGLVLRAAESDGGYGNVVLTQEGPHISLTPNGDPKKKKYFTNWIKALESAEETLRDSMDTEKEHRVVVSRLIEFDESPGLSLLIVDGEIYSLGWNEQIQENGSKACVGTTNHNPKGPKAQERKIEYEDRSIQLISDLLYNSAQNLEIPWLETRGIVNADIMIPSTREKAFRGKDIIYLAEINPRWTNWSDAVQLAAWILGKPLSAKELQETSQLNIRAVDKFPVKIHDMNRFRQIILEVDYRLKQQGTRVILRMPDPEKPGIIFIGNIKQAEELLRQEATTR